MPPRRRTPARPLALVATLATTFLMALGCGETIERVPVAPLSGKVTSGGKPAQGAMLKFHPLTPNPKMEAYTPIAFVDPDGAYYPSTYDDGDGVPPGEYEISVTWEGPAPKAAATAGPEDAAPTGGDRLKGKYASPKTSGLKVKVEPDKKNEYSFELK